MAQSTQEKRVKSPHVLLPSFHFRTGVQAVLPYEVSSKVPTSSWGFPKPGPQSPTSSDATASHYFVSPTTWEEILDHGDFDDIVVGSGFCALAYVEAALRLDPYRKILILERGEFWLPEHFQNLPLPFKLVLGGRSETFPWQLSSKTFNGPLKFMHGSCPFFGGRSTFWSAWSPRASGLMRDFSQSMIKVSESDNFWDECEELLHVTKANKINDPIFGQTLQTFIQDRLNRGIKNIPSASFTDHASLSVGRKTSLPNSVGFEKFSTPGPLLSIYERQSELADSHRGHPLSIATEVIVESFDTDPDDGRLCPTVLRTSRGSLCFPNKNTNIILAAGTIPSTTLLMNSTGDKLNGRAGSRLGGHFLSHITARFPIEDFPDVSKHLEIGASYLAGKHPVTQLQYQIQITAIHSPFPKDDANDAGRLCPDYAAAATAEQLEGSEKYVVLVCATLGEIDVQNQDCWVRRDPGNPDPTTNIRLQVVMNKNSNDLWDLMDKATYDAIKVMAGQNKIEYWHDQVLRRESIDAGQDLVREESPAGWRKDIPPQSMIRIPGVVHETSTLYMSDNLAADIHASVDSNYQPYSCDNVYVTGGALFPTSGSWNRK